MVQVEMTVAHTLKLLEADCLLSPLPSPHFQVGRWTLGTILLCVCISLTQCAEIIVVISPIGRACRVDVLQSHALFSSLRSNVFNLNVYI